MKGKRVKPDFMPIEITIESQKELNMILAALFYYFNHANTLEEKVAASDVRDYILAVVKGLGGYEP